MTDGTHRAATAASGVRRARLEGGKRSGGGWSAAEESRETNRPTALPNADASAVREPNIKPTSL